MKSLFNDREMMNEDGCQLSREVAPFLKQLLLKWKEKGFRSVEIKDVILGELSCIDAELRLIKSIEISRKKRKQLKCN